MQNDVLSELIAAAIVGLMTMLFNVFRSSKIWRRLAVWKPTMKSVSEPVSDVTQGVKGQRVKVSFEEFMAKEDARRKEARAKRRWWSSSFLIYSLSYSGYELWMLKKLSGDPLSLASAVTISLHMSLMITFLFAAVILAVLLWTSFEP